MQKILLPLSDDVVRIGVMADQSGPYSSNGGPGSTLAVRMAVEDFGGKVLGRNIEVMVATEDGACEVDLPSNLNVPRSIGSRPSASQCA